MAIDAKHSTDLPQMNYPSDSSSHVSTIFTIGHSNQSKAEFLELLITHKIECVIDVRSRPRAWRGYFNRKPLEVTLANLGIEYLYLGEYLGGHPEDENLYVDGRGDIRTNRGDARISPRYQTSFREE